MDSYSKEELLQAILSSENIKFFWKDKERRFLGVNKSFLDYYGFKSDDVLIGKTDEDMGWHVDPGPFKTDEETVLNEGRIITARKGTCIIRGKLRHIEATKMPVRDSEGNIVGLVGYFVDVTDTKADFERVMTLSFTDPLTALPNRNSFYDVVHKYIDSYKKYGTDFVIFYISVGNLGDAVTNFGHTFGEKLLKIIRTDILTIVGSDSLVFSFGAGDFVILHQLADNDSASISNTAWSIEEKLRSDVASVYYIDGHSILPDAHIGFESYSSMENIEDLLEAASGKKNR